MSLNASFLSGLRSNGNTKPFAAQRARLLFPVIEQEQIALWYEAPEMRYARFNYDVKPKAALFMPPVPEEPQFPAVHGRLAYANGRYFMAPDTVVSYRKGRRVHTEWHALARIGA